MDNLQNNAQFKKCRDCKRLRVLEDFPACTPSPSGKPTRRTQCARCWNAQKRTNRKKNSALYRATAKAAYYRDIERMRAYSRAYEPKRRNKEERRRKNREYAAKNRKKLKAKNDEWVRKHPERVAEYGNRRRAMIANAATQEMVDRAAIIRRDKSTCYLCFRVVTGRNLCLDHVVPLSRGGDHVADNLRVACRSCNSKKRSKMLSEFILDHRINGVDRTNPRSQETLPFWQT